jgi:hypothetical protein
MLLEASKKGRCGARNYAITWRKNLSESAGRTAGPRFRGDTGLASPL